MSLTATTLPIGGSGHLDLVVDEVERSAARLRTLLSSMADEELTRLATSGRASIATATLHLDGAPPGGPTDRMPMGGGPLAHRSVTDAGTETDASADGWTGGRDQGERPGTWLDALRMSPGIEGTHATGRYEDRTDGSTHEPEPTPPQEGPPDAEVARLLAAERDGVHAALEADDLLEAFSRATADASGLGAALCVLHGRLTAGLVDAGRAGRLRRGPRVVHDASVGRIIFFPTDPESLSEAWDALLRGLTSPTTTGTPPVVRAGLLHLELLRHHPFDAANGRLARAAARLVLRSDAILPAGSAHELVAIEAVLDEDPLGYLDGVAASARRRDATGWIERWCEAVTLALVRTGRDVAPGVDRGSHGDLPLPRADAFTLAEAMEVSGADLTTTRRRLSVAVVEGEIERVIGSAGLRYFRPDRPRDPRAQAASDRDRHDEATSSD